MQKVSSVKTKKVRSQKRTGKKYECGICGMAITVDRDCGCTEATELICCDKSMRPIK